MFLLPIVLWWAKSPMRFSVGRSRQVVCMLSLWSFVLAVMPLTDTALADQPIAADPTDIQQHVLREGTVIAPTDGKIVAIGRHWAFVPKSEMAVDTEAPVAASRFQSTTNIRLVGRHRVTIPQSSVTTDRRMTAKRDGRMFGPVTLVAIASDRSGGGAGSAATSKGVRSTSNKQLILIENLMLERIVEAVRADASDDRWILSGKVTEYFGENRMVVKTAQRSNAE